MTNSGDSIAESKRRPSFESYDPYLQQDFDNLEAKLFEAVKRIDVIQQEDDLLMMQINEGKMTLGKSLYKLNLQFKKKKKQFEKQALKFTSPDMRHSYNLEKQSDQSPIEITHSTAKENLPNGQGQFSERNDFSTNLSSSFDSLILSPVPSHFQQRQHSQLQQQQPLQQQKSNAAKKDDELINSSYMKIEKHADKSLNSLLAFTAEDDASEGPFSPLKTSPNQNHSTNPLNRLPLSSLSPSSTLYRSSSNSQIGKASLANELLKMQEELRTAKSREMDLKRKLEV